MALIILILKWFNVFFFQLIFYSFLATKHHAIENQEMDHYIISHGWTELNVMNGNGVNEENV